LGAPDLAAKLKTAMKGAEEEGRGGGGGAMVVRHRLQQLHTDAAASPSNGKERGGERGGMEAECSRENAAGKGENGRASEGGRKEASLGFAMGHGSSPQISADDGEDLRKTKTTKTKKKKKKKKKKRRRKTTTTTKKKKKKKKKSVRRTRA
jgi:hypothetical protein